MPVVGYSRINSFLTSKVQMDNKGIIDYKAESGRCRFVDKNLGRTAQNGEKRHPGGRGTCQGTSEQKRKRKI